MSKPKMCERENTVVNGKAVSPGSFQFFQTAHVCFSAEREAEKGRKRNVTQERGGGKKGRERSYKSLPLLEREKKGLGMSEHCD